MSALFNSREKFWLRLIAAVGLVGLNGVFLYYALFRSEVYAEALRNPVSLVFMIEALAVTGLFAYLFAKWGVGRLHWAWFLVLSLVGGLLFAVPAFLLIRNGGESVKAEETRRRTPAQSKKSKSSKRFFFFLRR